MIYLHAYLWACGACLHLYLLINLIGFMSSINVRIWLHNRRMCRKLGITQDELMARRHLPTNHPLRMALNASDEVEQ